MKAGKHNQTKTQSPEVIICALLSLPASSVGIAEGLFNLRGAKMTITIKHHIIKGKRNLNERLRVNNINKHIGAILWSLGLTINDVDFNSIDKWIVNRNIPTLQQKLNRYPTVSITV